MQVPLAVFQLLAPEPRDRDRLLIAHASLMQCTCAADNVGRPGVSSADLVPQMAHPGVRRRRRPRYSGRAKKKLLILLFVLLLSLLVALCRCCSFVINSMLALFYCVFVSGTRRPLAKRVEKKVQRAKRALRGAKEAFTTIVPGLARLCLAMSIGVLPLRSHMLLSQTTTHSYNTRCLACRPPAQCKTCVFGFHTTTLSEYTS